MGAGSWDPGAYRAYSSTIASTTSAKEVFRRGSIADALNPKGIAIRESRDSADNPASTPLLVALDVTGSMGSIAHALAKEGLGTLFEAILDRKPITDPHIAFAAVGDVNVDSAPFQISQFEADARIIEQLTSIYVEGGGGGNEFESYDLPWYFAGYHVAHDAMEKRGRKGYLFTVGDERAPRAATAAQIKAVFGDDLAEDLTAAQMLEAAQRLFHVFHVVVKEGSAYRYDGRGVDASWHALLGQRVIPLDDYTKLAEVVVSAIQVVEGADKDKVAKSWGGKTDLVVASAIRDLAVGAPGAMTTGGSGLVRF
jgi:hypothetical protein